MRYLIGIISVLVPLSALSGSIDPGKWSKIRQAASFEWKENLRKRSGAMSRRQKEIGNVLSNGIPYCAYDMTSYQDWLGDEKSAERFRYLEGKCIIQVFSEQLDREDWRTAEEINTVVKKLRPELALPYVDDRE